MTKKTLNEKQLAAMKEILSKPVKDLTLHVSAGNTKVPYMNIGTPAIMTCPAAASHNCDCAKTGFCYADGIESQRIHVFKGNFENLILFVRDPEKFEKLFDNAIKLYTLQCKLENKPAIVRLNESGDFFSIPYTKMIIRRINENPETFFYGYTRQWIDNRYDFINELPFHSMKNANIMFSYEKSIPVPAKYDGFYKIAYAAHLNDAYDIIESAGALHCNGNCEKCNACVYGTSNVCFVIHGKKGIDKIPEKVNFPYINSAGLKYDLPRYVNKENPHFYKTDATTFQGVRDIICKKIMHDNSYENRTIMLYETYKLYRAGKIEIYKNGVIINM